MRLILIARSVSALLFIVAAFSAPAVAKVTPRVCGPLNLNWQLSDCPSQEACLLETIQLATENTEPGNGCEAICQVGCHSSWNTGDLYRSNNCAQSGTWYASGVVGCYCADMPGGGH